MGSPAGPYVLLAVLFLPLVGALFVMLMPKEESSLHRGFGIAFSLASFLVSLALLGMVDSSQGGLQLIFDKTWIPGLNAKFKIGIDGISLWLVLLTTFLTPLILLSARNAITTKVREFIVCVLILETAMLGAFLALDIFLFYVFWEIMLIPMYLLIGIWGGKQRMYASIKFVLYTMVGSLLMLAAIFYVYVQFGSVTGEYTTDLTVMMQKDFTLPYDVQVWCFAAFALAFAIKVPLFPLHTWLPDAHVQAPTAGSVILASVLLKFGVYGMIRFAVPLFPHGAEVAAPVIAVLSAIAIVYGAVVAFAQDDVKKLVAYSSVSHMGFCTLGLVAFTAIGFEGSMYAMLSHGLTTGGLFLAIGVLYERRHTRRMDEFGGLWKQMPIFAGCFLIVTLGSAGLPGLSGFIGEFMSIFGTFGSAILVKPKILAIVAALGIILGAVYLLYMFQKVMFGPLNNERNKSLSDLSAREIAVFAPIIALIFVMGIYPKPFLGAMHASVDCWLGSPDKTEKYNPPGCFSSFHKRRQFPDGPARLMSSSSPSSDGVTKDTKSAAKTPARGSTRLASPPGQGRKPAAAGGSAVRTISPKIIQRVRGQTQ